jgi:hypothetical protein
MRLCRHFIIGFVIIAGFLSCDYKSVSDQNVDFIASTFIKQADSSIIQTFKTWGYGRRGEAEIWSKQIGDSSIYGILYFDSKDTTVISLSKLTEFRKDFKISIDLDTIRFWRFLFKGINNKVRIVAIDTLGRDSIFAETYDLISVFPNNNPFQHFKELTELKDSLGIIGSSYIPRIGEFIQFYLSPEYVLTYLPDTSLFDNRYKAIWMKEFSKGKTIDKIWNLRKLDQPKDNG